MDFIDYDPRDWRDMEDHPQRNGWYETISVTKATGRASDGSEKTILGVSLFRNGEWVDTPYKGTRGWRGPMKARDADGPIGYYGAVILAEAILTGVCEDFRRAFSRLADTRSGVGEIYAYESSERLMRSDYITALSMGADPDARVKHNQNAVLRGMGVRRVDETRKRIVSSIERYHTNLKATYKRNRRIAKENLEWISICEELDNVCKHSLADDTIKTIIKAIKEGV